MSHCCYPQWIDLFSPLLVWRLWGCRGSQSPEFALKPLLIQERSIHHLLQPSLLRVRSTIHLNLLTHVLPGLQAPRDHVEYRRCGDAAPTLLPAETLGDVSVLGQQ